MDSGADGSGLPVELSAGADCVSFAGEDGGCVDSAGFGVVSLEHAGIDAMDVQIALRKNSENRVILNTEGFQWEGTVWRQ